MGDKGVKAIAVRGTKDVNLARGAEFIEHVNEVTKYIKFRNANPNSKRNDYFVWNWLTAGDETHR